MNQLTQQEHDYLFLRLCLRLFNDIATTNKTYSRKDLASEATRQIINMPLAEARELAEQNKKDMEILYQVYSSMS